MNTPTAVALQFRPRTFVGGVAFGILLADFGLCQAQVAAQTSEKAAAPIQVNSIGYLVDGPKAATVAEPGAEFIVRDVHTNEEVFRGRATPRDKTPMAAQPAVADFSPVRRPGEYRIEIEGSSDTSPRFQIAENVYNWPFYCTVRGMYLWRCGTAVDGEFAGDTFKHAACHLEDGHLDEIGEQGQHKDGVGGWHDAGDYNKYTGNGAFAVALMLKAWEHFPNRLESLRFDIPESGNEMPDFLDEARWELEWLLKMQAADGSVYHKLSTLQFGGFILPEKETTPRYFCPWGSAGTADFVAVMAQAARIFASYDAQFSKRCLAAAEKSYDFLAAHPENHEPDQAAFSTGPYNSTDADDRLWAAAELWETTGDAKYLKEFERRAAEMPKGELLVDSDWDWGDVSNLGMFTYVLSEREDRDPELLARVRDDVLKSAAALAETAERHPYRRPLGDIYYWGCNGTVARVVMNLHVADRLSGRQGTNATAINALDFLFGRNPYGRSFVTGLGHQPPLHPHDRRCGGDDVAAPWPGYLVGGGWPGPNDWNDDQEDYRTNETAINWNGALIYAMSGLIEPATFEEAVAESRDGKSSD